MIKHGLAEHYPWQERALFLNGNLAEKRRAERLGMMAHLLLAFSAQSLPLAQPESRLCLLTMPAKPLLAPVLGWPAGYCCWRESRGRVAKLHHQPLLLPCCLSSPPPNILSHSFPSLPPASQLPCWCLLPQGPTGHPSSLSPMTVLLPGPSWPPQDTLSPSGLSRQSPPSSAWPSLALSLSVLCSLGSPSPGK